ncbi:very short patch repair endonuclease [Alteriqipengyuania lutimaris]|uniref:Very short patch repair endonuclease n=1 Tax=Alteriqipengyuania lutimaris TaxID=1538146 RepID=A0A395LP49_9SPHN|nr:DNA mismatch endonuclease Vsr [Alteriqipengyuania lutimaris]MBB3034679.1 DNA mismatch endonuclease (patch repair protein) [Alteriqipengyuania lutimaris]RDS76460.1 DNA mismatch endonuclease Vsr [Alteriqipengyuania lutimaris]
MDHLDPERRSENMRRVKGKDTGPELTVRHALHTLGRRFRLHRKDLPGKPDIVLAKNRLAIFVHGCFWHRHENCPRASMPSTRREFWESKFARTVERDAEQAAALRAAGWQPEVIWECETRDAETLSERLRDILERNNPE